MQPIAGKNKIGAVVSSSTVHLTYRVARIGVGGPAGVIAVLREVFEKNSTNAGNKFESLQKSIPICFAHTIQRVLGLNSNLIGGYGWARRIARKYPRSSFVAHDLWTALGLASLSVPYALVYHSQGSVLHEQRSFGNDVSFLGRILCFVAVKVAFSRAIYVSFPSHGAKDAFNETSGIAKHSYKLGPILYNTILPAQGDTTSDELLIIDEFECIDAIKVVSIGALTDLKGIDLVCGELSMLAQRINKQICFFVVGDGPLRERIYECCQRSNGKLQLFHLPQATNITCRRILRAAGCYMMLHRLSIFDLATLEAMSEGCSIILSKKGGNLEYNVDHNIVFHGDLDWESALIEPQTRYLLGIRNMSAFDTHFSPERFRARYLEASELLHSPSLLPVNSGKSD